MKSIIPKIVSIGILLTCWQPSHGTSVPLPSPRIHHGILDLRTWDFKQDGIVPLQGEWEFYWHHLIQPDRNGQTSLPEMTGYCTLPGLWNNYMVKNRKLGGIGYASYRLTVLLNHQNRASLAFKLMTINTAYSLIVNNHVITGNGIATSDSKTTIAQYLPHVASFLPDRDTLDIVLHVANYKEIKGGPWKTIYLGDEETIREKRERKIAFELFLLGSILIIGVHYLTIYLLRKKDKVSLFFSIFCFSIALRTLLIGERYLNHLFPHIPWDIMRRTEFLTMHMSTATFCVFMSYLFRHEYAVRVRTLAVITSAFFACMTLVMPISVASFLAFPFEIIIMLFAAYTIHVVIQAIRHKREGGAAILIGCIVIFSTVINDILFDNSLVQTIRLVPCGLFLFIFSQAIVLSRLSANAHTKIENLSSHLAEMNKALKRFVPYEFLHYLEKNNIIEVRLGDQVLKRMTILFSDIRSFTSISENMTPQENFNFLNSYLEKISPAITTHKGFIDKYVGDAIMALFPDTVDDALNAAIDIQAQVSAFNQQLVGKNIQPIAVGIGMHTGSLMLGTIGNDMRMETTVISDTVNCASRMEELTKLYGGTIIVSKQMLDQVQHPGNYHIRYLDTVQVKGKSEPVTIIEILDGLSEEQFTLKIETKTAFENGIEEYRRQHLKQAMAQFNAVLQANPMDKAAQVYLDRCNHFKLVGFPEGWNGIAVLKEK